jgi:hypothetical protein
VRLRPFVSTDGVAASDEEETRCTSIEYLTQQVVVAHPTTGRAACCSIFEALSNLPSSGEEKRFNFAHCYDSSIAADKKGYSGQAVVSENIGDKLLESALSGQSCVRYLCLFS